MSKRFVETTRWLDPWFGNLRPEFKLLYIFLCDHCDNAGVWNVNKPLAEKFIGLTVSWDLLIPAMEGRIIELAGGKRWLLAKFLEFQYAPGFNANIPAHHQARRLLMQHGLDASVIPWLLHGGGTAVGRQSPRTGQDTDRIVSLKGSAEGKQPSKGDQDRLQIAATCRHLVICDNEKSIHEWFDALKEHGECRRIDDALDCMEWAVNTARDEGKDVAFMRHCINYIRQWPSRRPRMAKDSA